MFSGRSRVDSVQVVDGYLRLYKGTTVASIDFETFVVAVHSTTGPVLDICAALA